MTCIVGVASDSRVFLGGERGSADSDSILVSSQPKVFNLDQYVIGYAGNIGLGQAVAYNFNPPEFKGSDATSHMVRFFIPSLRKFFKDNDISLPDKTEEHTDFIVGVSNKIYGVSSYDFQCVEYPFLASGSGASFALGSLYSSQHLPDSDRVRLALNASIEFSPTCLGPIDIVST